MNAASSHRWWFFNYCQKCGVRIRWREHAFFGNAYKPVVCTACANVSRARIYGSVALADAALFSAAAREVREYGWPT